MRTLKHLFLDELADRYDAEKRLVIAMPKTGNTEAASLLQEILVEEKAANHALSELARSRSTNEALGDCAATDFCGDGRDAKSWNGRRGVRPVGEGSFRPAPMAH